MQTDCKHTAKRSKLEQSRISSVSSEQTNQSGQSVSEHHTDEILSERPEYIEETEQSEHSDADPFVDDFRGLLG